MRRDPVTPETYAAVRARDGGCVGPRVGLPGPCDGSLELDHIRSAGLGKRGPSTVDNLVTLCRYHHRWKTEHARATRPLLIEWTEGP